MRTIKEYYSLALEKHLNWLSHQKEQWWKNEKNDYLFVKGDYIETVHFLTNDEKNDSSLFHNHTNVKNSEWGIFFSMLGQILVDWCCENINWKNLDSFNIEINRELINYSSIYICSFSVYKYDFDNHRRIKEENNKELEKFDNCRDFICDALDWFMSKHGKDIPNNWNCFSFGLDALMYSCEYRQWVCTSDGYINLGNYNNITNIYDKYVECM